MHSTVVGRLVRLVGSGKISFEKVMAKPFKRHGLLVVSQRRPFSPVQQKAIARAIERHEEKIVELSVRPKKPKSLVDWEKRANVLRRMRSLGFRPHASIVASGLAFEYGLEKEKLLPQLNSFRTTNNALKGALYQGGLGYYCQIVRLDLPSKIQKLLSTSEVPLDSGQIAAKLQLSPNRKTKQLITASLGLLDLMHLTVKLPPEKEMHYRWIHSSKRFSSQTIPNNLDWKILQVLQTGSKRLTELSLPVKLPSGKIVGSTQGLDFHTNVKKSLLRLQRAGLIGLQKEYGMHAKLSKYGGKLMGEQSNLPYLHPKLRPALLGMARQPGEAKPSKKRTLNLILRWIKVHKAVQEARKKQPTQRYPSSREIAGALGETIGFVHTVSEGRMPWKRVPKKELEQYYIPLLDPTSAKYLMDFLSTRK